MTSTDPTAPPSPSRARRTWAHAWRLLLALVVGGSSGLAIYGVGLSGMAELDVPPTAATWFVVDLLCVLVCAPLYVLRRRAPLVITGVLVVLGSFSLFSVGLVILAVLSLATRRQWLEIGAVYALWCGAALVSERAFSQWVVPTEALPAQNLWAIAAQLVFSALVVVTGMFIGGRRALVASLREQAAIARRESDARGDSARAAERNRIAREMHDVLAHRLSLVALHSGALEYRAGLDPEQVRETAAVVRENAHEALGELREVLGLLRDPSAAEESSRPQPTFAQVGELVEGTRAAGSPVTFVLDRVGEDDLARLPVSTSRHLYRVVQETLTNARKHAPGAPVHVRLHGAPGERIALEVTNPVPEHEPATRLPTSGWGLTGLSERVRLTGGELDARRRADGTFMVQAWLPWAAATEGQT
ncbi:sensor histidine kinase [Cellulomonas dongxiuzhuiae]|uniref:histidine kinase n=1 Tax=Cellulomonas dongxiuzhuiae TaxID=2819979 RepID=A0ABX8GLB5_9CELL|nr:histidine kinase [Cellulomonas dongxiuzhuiae]MBO3096423.1 two-component sensor histidine kinase [Cellulomonas dongxiuzhuiae]QWC16830.1 two-component sensor histidine kinase [Cellulomonas dongxiuzhuiae]